MSGRIFFIPLAFCFLGILTNQGANLKLSQHAEREVLVNSDSISNPFEYLKQCMDGHFDSELQSQQDSDFFHINLKMLPIWPEYSNDNQFFLYVEQAVASSLDKPYRQRIYKVEKISDNSFVSHIYMMADQDRFIGKNGSDAIFKQIAPDSLQPKDGCEVYLSFDPLKNSFSGSTGEKTCPSDLRGASYASSKVTIENGLMVSWDQGFDKEGKQVWGAVKGGYIFRKKN